MPSRKTPGQRRASLPRRSDYTRTFLQDWKRLSRAGKLDLHRLKEVMLLLIADDAPLGAEWRDHELKGADWKGCRECHVGGDILLVYRIGADGTVVFVTTGSHSELFG